MWLSWANTVCLFVFSFVFIWLLLLALLNHYVGIESSIKIQSPTLIYYHHTHHRLQFGFGLRSFFRMIFVKREEEKNVVIDDCRTFEVRISIRSFSDRRRKQRNKKIGGSIQSIQIQNLTNQKRRRKNISIQNTVLMSLQYESTQMLLFLISTLCIINRRRRRQKKNVY